MPAAQLHGLVSQDAPTLVDAASPERSVDRTADSPTLPGVPPQIAVELEQARSRYAHLRHKDQHTGGCQCRECPALRRQLFAAGCWEEVYETELRCTAVTGRPGEPR